MSQIEKKKKKKPVLSLIIGIYITAEHYCMGAAIDVYHTGLYQPVTKNFKSLQGTLEMVEIVTKSFFVNGFHIIRSDSVAVQG